jgi:hypothetical protein
LRTRREIGAERRACGDLAIFESDEFAEFSDPDGAEFAVPTLRSCSVRLLFARRKPIET